MGYSIGDCSKHNRFIGYGVSAYCDHPGCEVEIDRGMGYSCCSNPFHTESCGGYYCSEHQPQYIFQDELEDMAEAELEQHGIERDEEPHDEDDGIIKCTHPPIDPDKEHPKWLKHVLTDESWQQWREENAKEVKRYQSLLNKCESND